MENKQIWGSETNTSENLFFEDNFDPVIHTNKTEFQKLNDSTEYLQLLENRLAKIKNDPTVLKQLREKREQCMRNLLDNGSASDFASQISLDRALVADEDTKTSEILRRINPQQALTGKKMN